MSQNVCSYCSLLRGSCAWTVFGVSPIEVCPKTFIQDMIWWFPGIVAFRISVPFNEVFRFAASYTTANNFFSVVDLVCVLLGHCCVVRVMNRWEICGGASFKRGKTVRRKVVIAKIRFTIHTWVL